MDFLDKLGMSISEIFNKLIGVLPKSPITYLEANPEIKIFYSYKFYDCYC